jgi:hypothetical protein
MSFTTFKNKPVSSKVVLFEFGVSTAHGFFLNEEPGIWRYRWYVSEEADYSYEIGAFCYGAFEGAGSGGLTNEHPRVNIVSVTVDGAVYSEVSSLASLRAQNESFWWDGEILHVHFDDFAPPWAFTLVKLGVTVNEASKAGIYNDMPYGGRLSSLSPLSIEADPLFYQVLGYSGLTAELANADGELDGLTALDIFGQVANVRYGEDGTDYADFELLYSGIIQEFSVDALTVHLEIADKRKRFTKSVPPAVFDVDDYPNIKAVNAGKPIPLAYGRCDNVPVICTNEEETSPASYRFKICDTAHHAIKAIDKVFVEGIEKIPSNTNLADATFELNTADYLPGDSVTADVRGYTKVGLNILANSGCERTAIPHIKGDGAYTYYVTFEHTSDRAHSQSHSFKLTKDGDKPGCYVSLTDSMDENDMHGFSAGKTYNFSAWVYLPSSDGPSAANEVSIQLLYYGSDHETWSMQVCLATKFDTWEKLTLSRYLFEDTTGVQLRVQIAGAAENGEYFYVDDLEVEAVDDPWPIENPLDVIEDLLTNHISLAYTSDNYDQSAWAAAKALAADIQYFTNKNTKIESIVEEICTTLNGVMYAKSNGKFTFRYLHAAKSVVETITREQMFAEPSVRYASDNFLSSLVLGYDRDYGEDEPLLYVDDAMDAEFQALYGMAYRYEADTLLNTEEDVENLAEHLLDTYAQVARWVPVTTSIEHIQLELMDDVAVNLDRAGKPRFGDIDMRVYGIRKDVMAGRVELTLRGIE